MSGAVKQTSFDEYQETLSVITRNIDELLINIKNRQKKLSVWHGYSSYKAFLKNIEKQALEKSSEELGIAQTTIRDRWKVLTLPLPVFSALEEGNISFSKAKLMTVINFDFENDSDIQIAKEIVKEVKNGKTITEIKKIVKEKSKDVWNSKDIVMVNLAKQLGIEKDSIF